MEHISTDLQRPKMMTSAIICLQSLSFSLNQSSFATSGFAISIDRALKQYARWFQNNQLSKGERSTFFREISRALLCPYVAGRASRCRGTDTPPDRPRRSPAFHPWKSRHEDVAMTTKNPAANAPLTVVANDPDDMKGTLKSMIGRPAQRRYGRENRCFSWSSLRSSSLASILASPAPRGAIAQSRRLAKAPIARR
jgi:hypothetical protein